MEGGVPRSVGAPLKALQPVEDSRQHRKRMRREEQQREITKSCAQPNLYCPAKRVKRGACSKAGTVKVVECEEEKKRFPYARKYLFFFFFV